MHGTHAAGERRPTRDDAEKVAKSLWGGPPAPLACSALWAPLQCFPFVSINMGLTQYARQEISANVSLMGIGYPEGDVSFDHKLVFSSGIRPFKPSLLERANQVASFDWTKPRHYATFFTVSSMPSITGRGRFL